MSLKLALLHCKFMIYQTCQISNIVFLVASYIAMLAAIGRFKLSIRFECGMITLCPIFENSAGSPVASLPKINEKRPFGRTSCKLHFASSINGYNSLSPYTFWYSSNESKYTKSVENIAPIDALTTFGSNASTAGG